MKVFLLGSTLLSLSISTLAQTTASVQEGYEKTIHDRSVKIVNNLQLQDSSTYYKTVTYVTNQYRDLNTIYTARDEAMKSLKSASLPAEELKTKTATLQEVAQQQVDQLHPVYLKNLGTVLNEKQIEMIKDGMTYGVAPLTYKAYQDEILTLTDVQKKQILAWLIEAREHAMDAESSDKKHAWFGKYKGRINNYLSKEGYDLTKEGEEWKKRRDAAANHQ